MERVTAQSADYLPICLNRLSCTEVKIYNGANSSRDMEGSQNSKSRSRDSFMTPIDLILHLFAWDPKWPICMPSLKFLPPTVPEIWRGPKILKASHMTPSRSLWHNFAVLRKDPQWPICVPNWISSFNRSLDMEESQNSKSRSRDPGHAPFGPKF